MLTILILAPSIITSSSIPQVYYKSSQFLHSFLLSMESNIPPNPLVHNIDDLIWLTRHSLGVRYLAGEHYLFSDDSPLTISRSGHYCMYNTIDNDTQRRPTDAGPTDSDCVRICHNISTRGR